MKNKLQIWKQTEKRICEPFATFHLADNLSLSIIGATTKELLTTTDPANVSKVDVLDPIQSVKDIYEKVKGKDSLRRNQPGGPINRHHARILRF